MRMPLVSYFVVMGATLTLALIFISSRLEPLGSPVATSQIVGVARPYMPEPERSPYAITGTNFAAAYKPAAARAAEALTNGSRRRYSCFVVIEEGSIVRVLAMPVELGRGGVARVLRPALTRQEQTRLDNASAIN